MTKLSTYVSYLPKSIIATTLAVISVLLVSTAVLAGFGPNRPTIKWEGPGTAGFDYVTFNSFTNIPNWGDERDFLRAKHNGADNSTIGDPIVVKHGDVAKVYMRIHNNANGTLNESGEGVAKDLKVRIAMPNGFATSQDITGYISASNAQPQLIWDTASFNSNHAVKLKFVPGSARLDSNFVSNVVLSDSIIGDGTLIGDKALDGTMRGCFEFGAWVTFLVEVEKEPKKEFQFDCDALTITKLGGRRVLAKVSASASPAEHVTITGYSFNFGDGTVVGPIANSSLEHEYAGDGPYTVTTTVHFSADGKTFTDECVASVQFKPVTPPGELPKTGPAAVIGALFGTSSLGVAVRNWLISRRALRGSIL